MNRRSFFGTVFGGFVAATIPTPKLSWRSIYDPVTHEFVIRKLFARVHITEELLADAHSGAFIQFVRDDINQLVRDIQFREGKQWDRALRQ